MKGEIWLLHDPSHKQGHEKRQNPEEEEKHHQSHMIQLGAHQRKWDQQQSYQMLANCSSNSVPREYL